MKLRQSKIELVSEFGSKGSGKAGDALQLVNAVFVDCLVELGGPEARLENRLELVPGEVEERGQG